MTVPPIPPQTQPMMLIPASTVRNLVSYLGGRPFDEVEAIIKHLRELRSWPQTPPVKPATPKKEEPVVVATQEAASAS